MSFLSAFRARLKGAVATFVFHALVLLVFRSFRRFSKKSRTLAIARPPVLRSGSSWALSLSTRERGCLRRAFALLRSRSCFVFAVFRRFRCCVHLLPRRCARVALPVRCWPLLRLGASCLMYTSRARRFFVCCRVSSPLALARCCLYLYALFRRCFALAGALVWSASPYWPYSFTGARHVGSLRRPA